MTPQGQETFRSTIIELDEDKVYADRTEYNGLHLTFRHRFQPSDGKLTVSHELIIEGAAADEVGPELGPQISEDFPQAMQSLFKIAADSRPSV